MKSGIDFYVGILPENRNDLLDLVGLLNEDSDKSFFVQKMREYDDPDGYYTFHLRGSWEAYKCFQNSLFVKSLQHDEEL
jgi:hypothetical protein